MIKRHQPKRGIRIDGECCQPVRHKAVVSPKLCVQRGGVWRQVCLVAQWEARDRLRLQARLLENAPGNIVRHAKSSLPATTAASPMTIHHAATVFLRKPTYSAL